MTEVAIDGAGFPTARRHRPRLPGAARHVRRGRPGAGYPRLARHSFQPAPMRRRAASPSTRKRPRSASPRTTSPRRRASSSGASRKSRCRCRYFSSRTRRAPASAPTPATTRAELEAGFRDALIFGPKVLVERYIRGRELTVGVLGDEVLPVIEIHPLDGFYDYANKYTKGKTEYFCPAPLPDAITQRVKSYASARTARSATRSTRGSIFCSRATRTRFAWRSTPSPA